MLHGVFEQELQRQGRQFILQQGCIDFLSQVNSRSVARFEQVIIRIDKRQFGLKRRQVVVVGTQQVALHTRQFVHEPLGLGGFVGDERGERVEAVEQKMRVQLSLQGRHLHHRHLLL